MTTPEAACGRRPLEGTPPAAWQSRFRGGRLGALIAFGTLALGGAVGAQTVSMAGSIGDSKALLMINGAPHTLAVGASVKGVTLKRVMPGQAEVEVGGRTMLVAIGGAPASVGAGSGGGASGREILLAMGPGGHFVASGLINGKTVQLMVDTGATVVAFGQREAERIGLDWKRGERSMTQTANGVVPVYRVSLTSVRIGDVEVFNVAAVVTPIDMPFVLLGNSFLNRFSMRRDADVLKLEKKD